MTKNPPAKGRGRPKGSQNKTTVAVKTALSLAFEDVGGNTALAAWARDNPTEFYKLWVKLLPQEITGDDGAPIKHEFSWLPSE